jgi:hypothetical protein
MMTEMTKMNETELNEHLLTLVEGYKNQLAQLIQGLEQMIMQKQQIDENIPLLETEVEVVTTKIAHLTKYLGIEEEE